MMKILHTNFSFTQGGIDNMMNDIMHVQYKLGLQVSLLIVNDQINGEVSELIPKGIKTYFLRRPIGSKNPYYILKAIMLILFVIRPNVIHCHNRNLGKICCILRHVMRCKCILTVHAMSYETGSYHNFDHIVAISQSVKDDICQSYRQDNVHVIYNGIDFEKIRPHKGVERNHPFRMIIVSRLDVKKKGHDTLLKAVSILKREGFDLHLDIVGDGAGLKEIEELIDKNELSNYVSIVGSRSREWVYNHLRDYDLLVQPSRYEGFGLTIVEGIAAHVPVLVSNIDGPKEITENGIYGWMFEAGKEQDLAEKIRSIVSVDIAVLQQKTMKDYLYMKEKFSIQKTAENYVKLYQGIL